MYVPLSLFNLLPYTSSFILWLHFSLLYGSTSFILWLHLSLIIDNNNIKPPKHELTTKISF
jgi:hypothetical protein